MNAVGIIAEYNPFHNGHLYHLEMVKKMYPNDVIVVVLGGHFMQRGEPSIINKWDKTSIALKYGADIVIELPYPFATQSADFFAKGSIQILKAINVKMLIFGSETNDIEKLKILANLQIENNDYDNLVKMHLEQGTNYPTALSKSLSSLTNTTVNTPNDILGISYIREIIKENACIEPISIKRTNDYHNNEINSIISSATSIRNALKNGNNIKTTVPPETYNKLQEKLFFIEDYFPYLKYQILNNLNNLNKFQTVDEGIENRIKKYIVECKTIDELILKIKTKRYTYSKIRRMLTHIMCNFTKDEAASFKNITYLRILGFSHNGQRYLNQTKKELKLPIITKFNKINDKMLDLEFRTTSVYASILNENDKINLIQAEYKTKPIITNNKTV